MSGYIIARVNVTDAEQYKQYMAMTPAAIANAGGRFIVRGGEKTTLEGEDDPRRIVVIEFESKAAAEAFYNSEEYGKCRAVRDGARSGGSPGGRGPRAGARAS